MVFWNIRERRIKYLGTFNKGHLSTLSHWSSKLSKSKENFSSLLLFCLIPNLDRKTNTHTLQNIKFSLKNPFRTCEQRICWLQLHLSSYLPSIYLKESSFLVQWYDHLCLLFPKAVKYERKESNGSVYVPSCSSKEVADKTWKISSNFFVITFSGNKMDFSWFKA